MGTSSTDQRADTCQRAMALAEQGLKIVFLGDAGTERGKIPRLKAWGKKATSDEDQIIELFESFPRANIGALLGPEGGIIDVEFDTPEGRKTADELLAGIVTSTYRSARSVHRLFKSSPLLPAVQKVECRGLEIRIGGGGKQTQSVLPPSIHPDGTPYEWLPGLSIHEAEIAEIPDHILTLIVNQEPLLSGSAADAPEGKSAEAWKKILAGSGEGSRNINLASLVGKQLHLLPHLEDQEAVQRALSQVSSWNEQNNKPPLPAWEVEQTFRSILRREQNQRASSGVGSRIIAEPAQIVPLSKVAPEAVAEEYCRERHRDGYSSVVYHQDTWLTHDGGKYAEVPPSSARADLVRHLQRRYARITTSAVGSVLLNVAANVEVPPNVVSPAWLGEGEEPARSWNPLDTLPTRSQLVNLRKLTKNESDAIVPTTPAFFNRTALDFEFVRSPLPPTQWLMFLDQLWPGDPESIRLLCQWIGHQLTPDTRYQKILMLVGPRRSGKGTIARILRMIVGERNCCAPTLAQLGTNFGLSPLIGKSSAIIGDARLGGRTDLASITERLLSISGEDAQTIDRKHRDPITTKLSTRFTVITNELPRLSDASGALAGRMLILRLTRSFYGNEDTQLFDRLQEERQGILQWAIEGWADLQNQRRFVQPGTGADLVDQMSELASPISSFVRDQCRIDSNASTTLDDLYFAYSNWSAREGIRSQSTKAHFSRDLTAALPEIRRVRRRADQMDSDSSREGGNPSQADNERRVIHFEGIEMK